MKYDVIAEGFMDSGVICMDELLKPLNGKIIIYSAGIGDQINFELELLERLKALGTEAELYAFDPTPKSLEYLSRQNLPDNFHVCPYAVSDNDTVLQFALPKSEGWVSGSLEDVKQDSRNLDFENKINVQAKSLKSIMYELGHSGLDLLKMDIEGSEFSALGAALISGLNIKQMCIDHHEHMFEHGNRKIKKLLSELRKSGYKIFYAEKNFNVNRNFSCIR